MSWLALENALHFNGRKLLDPLPYLRQRKVLLLESPDQPEPVDMFGPIMGARPASFGGRQETLTYIVANGPRADLRTVAELEDVDRFGFGDIEHMVIITVILSTVKSRLTWCIRL
jgi:hypothetical protein